LYTVWTKFAQTSALGSVVVAQVSSILIGEEDEEAKGRPVWVVHSKALRFSHPASAVEGPVRAGQMPLEGSRAVDRIDIMVWASLDKFAGTFVGEEQVHEPPRFFVAFCPCDAEGEGEG
jgi:hypothetical protein